MCYLRQKIVAEVSPDVLIAANPGFPARNWNPSWKCWSMFWAFWGKILILNSVARPLWPKAYPDILEERLICCVVFRQRSLIRTHRELGKSSPEEDRCTSLLVPHITVSCGFFFAKMSQQSQTTKPTCSLTNILDLSWLPLGRKGHQGINWWRRLGSFRWFLILRGLPIHEPFQDIVHWRQIYSIFAAFALFCRGYWPSGWGWILLRLRKNQGVDCYSGRLVSNFQSNRCLLPFETYQIQYSTV